MRRPLWLMLAALCLSCQPTNQTPVPIYDIGPMMLVRDHQTASAYTNCQVRIMLEPTEYEVRGAEIHVCLNESGAPPALICRIDTQLSKPYPALTVIGTCSAPVRDGIKRSRWVDFFVIVDKCSVTIR